jgi:hypothetical protein
MNPDDLDSILISEKAIDVTPSFAREVMARIESEASNHPRISFPWIPFAAIMLILAVIVIWVFPVDPALRAAYLMSNALGQWMIAAPNTIFGRTLLFALASLLGSFLLIWISLRLVEDGN